MKVLKQILFTAALMIGIAISASAQSGDQPRKPPPKDKDNTPKIKVPDDKKPPPTPKDPPKDKKPGFAYVERRREFSGTVV